MLRLSAKPTFSHLSPARFSPLISVKGVLQVSVYLLYVLLTKRLLKAESAKHWVVVHTAFPWQLGRSGVGLTVEGNRSQPDLSLPLACRQVVCEHWERQPSQRLADPVRSQHIPGTSCHPSAPLGSAPSQGRAAVMAVGTMGGKAGPALALPAPTRWVQYGSPEARTWAHQQDTLCC